jgi:hypothetical protein
MHDKQFESAISIIKYQLKTKMGLKQISLISIYLNNDIVMGISL